MVGLEADGGGGGAGERKKKGEKTEVVALDIADKVLVYNCQQVCLR